ncbi:MAG TPA: hypothetical protein VMZ69_10030 [Saprospiraceae bacterium]|nr:hypothetical protein [Saprospiraceae bacterium]
MKISFSRTIVFGISLICVLAFSKCKSGEKAPASGEKTQTAENSPCNIAFIPDTIVSQYWVGMPRDTMKPEFIEFPFKWDTANIGYINFTPVWDQDTMVQLKMLIKPIRGNIITLMRESLKIVMNKRKQGCAEKITGETIPTKLYCGRTAFTVFPESSTIIISDACRDLRKNK